MTTSQKLEESFKKVKKHYIAELLNISRPTLNTKLENDDFTEDEIIILVKNNVISQDEFTA